MLKITTTGLNATPETTPTLNEALTALRRAIDAGGSIGQISAKQIVVTLAGYSGRLSDRTTIAVTDERDLALPLIALARNALFFQRRVRNSFDLQMVEKNQPYTERVNLRFGPRPDRETGFHICGDKGTSALLFTLGIRGEDAFVRLNQLTARDLSTLVNEMLEGNPVEIAKGYGIL